MPLSLKREVLGSVGESGREKGKGREVERKKKLRGKVRVER